MQDSSPNNIHFSVLQNIPRIAILQKDWMRQNSIKIPPNIDPITLKLLIQDIHSLEKEIKSDPTFAKNSKRKNFFLAVCKCINLHTDLYDVNVKSPFGGLIGVIDFRHEGIVSFLKKLRMHTVPHDASSFMKIYSNEGPGYIYALGTHYPELLNTCFLGHITGAF